ncbi:hypothetical protein GCM10010399_53070 [Dactylosporangium fulvum]|uniref:Uncharacterized protein n=1 Tax=Dactylosporangium fulvum TaxID=53359 RepID=A0ABY5VQE5_9ACTN|nr:hypothetical protein [Dactylosporangium fulvum]UWP79034.1 hypothetical protein Dfulv_28135 [Dactylosporangium fulvum]
MAFIVLLIVLAAVAAVSSIGAWCGRCRRRDLVESVSEETPPEARWAVLAVVGDADPDGERVEAVLTTWLLSGYLSAEDYRRDMADLALHDDLRHPLIAPPDR